MSIATLPSRAQRPRARAVADDMLGYERALVKLGFRSVAGVDEAGRGACAGPLVVAAVVLGTDGRGRQHEIAELADSKLLTAAVRDRVYDRVLATAQAWSVVVLESTEVDRRGLHVSNIEGMRRALARLSAPPDYVISDGFPVPGIVAPNLGVWKGDRVCACVAAAGVVAKVTRDRIMVGLHDQLPEYGFDEHKGYVTARHRAALDQHGPSDVHRQCFLPVRLAAKAMKETSP